jgi:sugar phosphate isomerase/epimerase
MKFDLGFVSAILADYSFEEVIDFASDNGFTCVELMCWPKGKAERRYAGVTHIDVDDLALNEVGHIKNYLKERKIYISGLGYYPNPLDADDERRMYYFNHLKKVIDAAQLLDVRVVNTFIGRNQALSLRENLELFYRYWPELIQYAQSHHVKIAIENCPMYFTLDEWPNGKNIAISPEIWDKLFEIDGGELLGLNYDPSHLVWQQMDYLLPLKEYSHKLFHVHLKDAKVNREKLNRVGILATPLEYHTPKLPGRGDIHWENFLNELKISGYKGPVVIEFEDKEFESSHDLVISGLIECKKYIQQILNRLEN